MKEKTLPRLHRTLAALLVLLGLLGWGSVSVEPVLPPPAPAPWERWEPEQGAGVVIWERRNGALVRTFRPLDPGHGR